MGLSASRTAWVSWVMTWSRALRRVSGVWGLSQSRRMAWASVVSWGRAGSRHRSASRPWTSVSSVNRPDLVTR